MRSLKLNTAQLIVLALIATTAHQFENYYMANYSTSKCIPAYNLKIFNNIQIYFTGCTQNPAVPGFMSNYLTFLNANLQSVAGRIQLTALPMVRQIATDGNKRVVFYHYDQTCVGIFIFLLNVSPYTYDQTVYFPKYPGHSQNFSQDFGFFPTVNSIAYVGARAGKPVVYRYNLDDHTKLDVGFLFAPVAKLNVHPKLGYAFSDGAMKNWQTLLITSQGYSTLTISAQDPSIT